MVFYWCAALLIVTSVVDSIDVSSKLDFDSDAPGDTSSKNLTNLSTGLVNAFINLQQNIQTSTKNDTLTDELIEFGRISKLEPVKLVSSTNLCVNDKCVQSKTKPDSLLTDLRVTVLANVNGDGRPTQTTHGSGGGGKDVPVFVGTSDHKNDFVPITHHQIPSVLTTHRSNYDHTGPRKPFIPYPYNTGDTNEFRMPHFDPTYHTHYFSESPPPQSVWISPDVVYRPDDDRAWNPSGFVTRNRVRGQYVTRPKQYTECVCPPVVDDSQYRGSNVNPVWRTTKTFKGVSVSDKIDVD